MTRLVASFIVLIYTVFGVGFWSVYNLRADRVEESTKNIGFATTSDVEYGQANFESNGNNEFMTIVLPDTWEYWSDTEILNTATYYKGRYGGCGFWIQYSLDREQDIKVAG